MFFLYLALLLALCAFFAASEISFVVANRLRVEVLARRSGVLGELLQRALDRPSMHLTVTLVGAAIALVTYATLVTLYFLEPTALWLERTTGMGLHGARLAAVAPLTLGASVALIVFGELLPRSVFGPIATRAIFFLVLPLYGVYVLLLPVIKLAGGASSLLVRALRKDAVPFSQFLRRDFEVIIQESKESGYLDEQNSTLLANVFAMSNIRVRESMVPRTDIVAVEETDTVEELRRQFIASGHGKLPVFRESIDQIVGFAFAHDLFGAPAALSDIIRPAVFVPGSKRSKDLLREFLANKTSVAIVVDEYGGTAGLVTTEDLLEELFGDIQDEHDHESMIMRQTGPHTFTLSGRVLIDDLREKFAVELPDGEYETIAGFLLDRVGAIPPPRAEFDLEGYRFVILRATPRRIDLVRLIRSPATPLRPATDGQTQTPAVRA